MILDPENFKCFINLKFSGFRILTSLKIAYLFIFRIQDPESSGSEDPDGKSHEGLPVLASACLPFQHTIRTQTGSNSPPDPV